VIDSILIGNSAYGDLGGGGIFSGSFGTGLTVIDGIFAGNFADNGGGLWSAGPAAVTDSLFISNSALNDGGGIHDQYNGGTGTTTVTGSFFVNNSATDGGGIYNLGTLINTKNVFFDNTGGDIYS
jgi:hypothetical protein